MDCSPPGSSVHGILQARILEWVAMLSSKGSSQPRDQTHISSSLCKEAEGKLTAGQTKTTRSQKKKVKEVGVARKKQEILRHVSKIN